MVFHWNYYQKTFSYMTTPLEQVYTFIICFVLFCRNFFTVTKKKEKK